MSIVQCGNGPCTAEIKNSCRGCANPIETHRGLVVRLGEHNWHDDSDFFALVWDEETQSVERIDYATTRCWTYHNRAQVDADEDTMAKANAYLAEQRRLSQIEIAKITAATVAPGKEVRSLTTRGKNKGVVGLVRGIGPSKYGRGDVAVIEVAGEDARRYIPIDRLEVMHPDQYLVS